MSKLREYPMLEQVVVELERSRTEGGPTSEPYGGVLLKRDTAMLRIYLAQIAQCGHDQEKGTSPRWAFLSQRKVPSTP